MTSTPVQHDGPTATEFVRTRIDVMPLFVGAAVALLPVLRPAGPGNTAVADVFLVAVVAFGLLRISRNNLEIRLPYGTGAALMMFGGIIAAMLADAPWTSVLVLAQDLLLLLWACALALGARDVTLVAALVRTWCFVAPAYAAVMVVAYLGGVSGLAGVTADNGARAAYTFPDPNLAANWLVVSILVMVACQRPRDAALRAAAIAVMLLAIVFTGSNGGMVTLVVGAISAVALHSLRLQGLLAGIRVLALACLFAFGTWVYVVPHVDMTALREHASASVPLLRDSIGRSDESSSTRQELVSEGIGLWFSSDGTGFGPARTKATLTRIQSPYSKEAHDDYLATLLERGPLGVVGLILFVGAVWTRCARLARSSLPPAYAAVVPRPWILAAAAPAFAVSATFYEVLHFRHLWTWLGLVAALELVAVRSRQKARTGHE
jgi:O-Antigen ligase